MAALGIHTCKHGGVAGNSNTNNDINSMSTNKNNEYRIKEIY